MNQPAGLNLPRAASVALLVFTAVAQAQQPAGKLSCSGNEGNSRRFRACDMRDMPVPATTRLAVDASPNGGVSITGSTRSDVFLRARVEAFAPTEADAKSLLSRINIKTAGAEVSADGPRGDGGDLSWSVSYEIFAPNRMDLNLRTVNGGLRIDSISGDIAFRTTNGGVTLSNLSGKVTGGTTNGGLTVNLAGDRWTGEVLDVTTTNGGVNLSMPANYSAKLEAGTTNGGFSSDIPVTLPPGEHSRHNIDTTLGAGGAPIRVRTTNGGIRIKKQS